MIFKNFIQLPSFIYQKSIQIQFQTAKTISTQFFLVSKRKELCGVGAGNN